MKYIIFYSLLFILSIFTSYACLLAGLFIKSLFNRNFHFSFSLVSMDDVLSGGGMLFVAVGVISAIVSIFSRLKSNHQ